MIDPPMKHPIPDMVQTGSGSRAGLHNLKKIWRPEWFQGNRKRKNYFEGWYIKSVSATGDASIAFIPGISLNKENPHAFVQVIHGKTGDTWYFKYAVEDFYFTPNQFAVKVGGNYFSTDGMEVDLRSENVHIKGRLSFSGQQAYPASLKNPGIMGWYRYMPFMECYHGVVSMDHEVTGQVSINEKMSNFAGGRGYIEKDWGSSMPKAWIWMQSNHFEDPGSSFMLSVARIPWIGNTFSGFLGYLFHRGTLTRFATYTGARVKSLEKTGRSVTLGIEGRDFYVHVMGEQEERPGNPGALKAPMLGKMERVIHESIDSQLYVSVTDKNGIPVFEGCGSNAGLEMTGDISLLAP